MRHAGIKKYVCHFCGVGKTTRQEWTQHINQVHTHEKRFTCEHCPHSTHSKKDLRLHVKVVHLGIKDFACQFCGKQFGKKYACQRHELSHTDDKRYECNVCGRKVLNAKSLQHHLKTHQKKVLRDRSDLEKHNTELKRKSTVQSLQDETKALSDDADSKVSIDNNDVNLEHASSSASATVNKPNKPKDYVCKYCDRGFSHSQTLRTHEMLHTGMYKFQNIFDVI